MVVAIVIIGVVVKAWGHYVGAVPRTSLLFSADESKVPYMVLGEAICIIGTAMCSQLHANTSTVIWATYFVIAGAGMGMAMQLPYTAIQITLL